jgi:hypothetical protein
MGVEPKRMVKVKLGFALFTLVSFKMYLKAATHTQ